MRKALVFSRRNVSHLNKKIIQYFGASVERRLDTSLNLLQLNVFGKSLHREIDLFSGNSFSERSIKDQAHRRHFTRWTCFVFEKKIRFRRLKQHAGVSPDIH